MRLIGKAGICRVATLTGIAVLGTCGVPGVAAAHQRLAHPDLALRAEAGGELVKVGSPAKDFFAGVENSEGFCQETALGRLRSNSRPIDRVEFSGAEEPLCSEGWRIVSGEVEEIELTASGRITQETSFIFEVPGDCVYSVRTLEAALPIPAELLPPSGPVLSGVARLRPRKSVKGCPATKAVKSEMDLSDVEFASPPYATELVEPL